MPFIFHLSRSLFRVTIQDFIYIWRYNGVPKEKIILDAAEWARDASKKKIREYAERYPKTVKEIVEDLVR